jgi:hypothetical protein
MNTLLLNKLKDNLTNTDSSILEQVIIQEYIKNINNSMNDLNELLEDVNTNNISNLQDKYNESVIEKKTMEPFIKYLMIYNTFIRNLEY